MPAAEAAEFAVGPAPVLRGTAAGEGTPIVLCHGLTASRRYVVHGSRALERAGHRVITYDARGHGESDPAPAEQSYGYPELIADLERVVEAEVGDRALPPRRPLDGRPHRGRLRARAPGAAERPGDHRADLHGGDRRRRPLAYWDGLAAALEAERDRRLRRVPHPRRGDGGGLARVGRADQPRTHGTAPRPGASWRGRCGRRPPRGPSDRSRTSPGSTSRRWSSPPTTRPIRAIPTRSPRPTRRPCRGPA